MSEAVQYTIVGVIIGAAAVWLLVKMIKRNKKGGSACCGCSLSDTCAKKRTFPKNRECRK